MTQRKVVVIGLDSISPPMVERFMAEGRMPNLKRLMEKGWFSEVIPTMPPTTPAGWATVATGAWPSTHGVEGFTIHIPGQALDKKIYACSSESVKAECIWQTAEKAGKRTILLKYPMSWPPTGGDKVLQVDGAGGWGGLKCVWDLAHSACWGTDASALATEAEPIVGKESWLARDQDNLYEEHVQMLQVNEPGEWVHLPHGAEPLWETQMKLQLLEAKQEVTFYLVAMQIAGEYRLGVAHARDEAKITLLNARQWSDWLGISISLPTENITGHMRLKVMAFDAVKKHLRLYQAQIHQASGYTRPETLANELLEAVGPFVEWTESYDRLQGWIDDETQLELYEQHVEWMSNASQYLLQHHAWDLFMTQVHFVDMAYHIYWGAVHPGHPEYDPQKAPLYWELLGRVHELADQFVGKILEVIDSETLVMVLGDHGHDLYHSSFMINHALIKEGLLTLYRDQRTGEPRIDWKRTRAFANGYRVFLNSAGRDPQGIVSLSESEGLREQIIRLLYNAQDPRSGEHPVRMAIPRKDAEALGLYGNSMGDIIVAMAPGFQARSSLQVPDAIWQGNRLQLRLIPLFRQTKLFREFSGEHDTSFPFTHAIHTLLFLYGPGIQQGRRRVPVRLVDVAPTICTFLDIPLPAQCEGSLLPDKELQLTRGGEMVMEGKERLKGSAR